MFLLYLVAIFNMFGAIDSLDQDCVFVSDDDVLTRIAADGTDATIAYGGSGSDINFSCYKTVYIIMQQMTQVFIAVNLTGTGATGTSYYPNR
jgi:hypothetical protein